MSLLPLTFISNVGLKKSGKHFIYTINLLQGSVFLVAGSWESLDGWLDAIGLVYTIYVRGTSDVLARIITG